MASKGQAPEFRAVRTASRDETAYVQSKPSSYLPLSIVAAVINFIFGGIAVCFSLSSRSASEEGNYKRAKQQARKALVLSLIGILVTVTLVVLLVVFLVILDEPDLPEATPQSGFLDSLWQRRIPKVTRPYWCEWYGYNSWYCKGPL